MSAGNTTTPTISANAVAQHVENGDIFLLDVRGSKGSTQIFGAISYDPKKLKSQERLVLPLPKSEGLIVLYDEDGDAPALEKIADKLRADGYALIRTLEGGFTEWEKLGGRTEERTLEQPVLTVTEP